MASNPSVEESPDYFKKRFKRSFSDEDTNDCVFEVGPRKDTIKGHKLLFAMASPVFKAMFYGELREEKMPIKIEDLDPKGFEGMKQFIYTEEVDFESILHACFVYAAARKYLIPDLCNKCLEHLKSILKSSKMKVFELYEFSKSNDISEIENLCCEFFQQETREIMESENFLTADIETVETVIKFETLNLNSELEVFQFVEKWAASEAGRKGIGNNEMASNFKSIKKHIRFLTMCSEQFAAGPGNSFLLTTEEKLAIGLNIIHFGSTKYLDNLSSERSKRNFTKGTKAGGILNFTFNFKINLHSQENFPRYETEYNEDGGQTTVSMHKYCDKFVFKLKCALYYTVKKIKAKFKILATNFEQKDLNKHKAELYVSRISKEELTLDKVIIGVIPSRDLFNEIIGYEGEREIILDVNIIDC